MPGCWRLQNVRASAGPARQVPRRVLLSAALAASLVWPLAAAQAQDANALSTATIIADKSVAPCVLQPYSAPAETGAANRSVSAPQPVVLLALCMGGAGIVLGETDRYQMFANEVTGALVVEMERLGRKRVMLLQRDEDGKVVVEDIGGSLAVAVGRTPTGGLRGVVADYSKFASEGTITLADAADGVEVAGRGAIDRPAFSLPEHNRERLSIMAASATFADGAR